MTDKRLQLLFDLLDEYRLDAVAINPGPALTYLTGLHFHLMERPTILIISKSGQPILILPELEIAKVHSSRISLQPFTFGDNPAEWLTIFEKAVQHAGLQKASIGIEPTRLRFLELNYLQTAAPSAKFLAAEGLFSKLRIEKDDSELQAMREAIKIAQNALKATLPFIKIDHSEKEIASELVVNLLRGGSESDLPFAPIIAGGPNSANPHAVPTDRKLSAGDLLVIDWGAAYNGYFSDLTRTFAIGQVDAELQQIYQIVKSANEMGRSTGKPGISAGKVDEAARSVIDAAGYGKFFTHRTGHGLGMEAHEAPYMFGENKQLLTPGMVYTIEPGIYLPGHGGVRIEDNIVVTTTGCETLSDYPREFTILD